MLLTTVKYVLIALRADNHGEGGIFSLYTLVRKGGKYLIVPAMIGGAALLADGVLTPAVTVTTAIEGLRGFLILSGVWEQSKYHRNHHVSYFAFPILIQRFGTDFVGKALDRSCFYGSPF